MVKDRDFVLGAGIFLFALFGIYMSSQQPASTNSVFEAGFYPMILSIVLALCGLSFLRSGWVRKQKQALPNFNNKGLIITAVMCTLYCFLLGPLGFRIATVLFLAAIYFYLGLRKIQHLVLLPVGLSLGIYYFFLMVLQVNLP